MGCSNPHPHCQVWATSHIPQEPAKELENLSNYQKSHNSCLLCDYVTLEINTTTSSPTSHRLVLQNESWIVVVPFWATWPFETLVLPKAHLSDLTQLSTKQQRDLSNALKTLTVKYDALFSCSFPYSMGIHQAPCGSGTAPVSSSSLSSAGNIAPSMMTLKELSHMHLHFYPPLLRSATVKKFLVGFEMLAEAQRDLTPEQGAERLRDV